jgi:hypothetical protein
MPHRSRLLALPLVDHQGFIQLSGAWSPFSCTLATVSFFSPSVQTARFCPLLQGFLLHSGSCFVEHAHRSGQGSGHPHVVWNATYRNHLGCLVSSRCVWFVCVFPALTWDRSLNVTQVILPVFVTTPSFLGTGAHSTHSSFTTYVSISFISAALYHTVHF